MSVEQWGIVISVAVSGVLALAPWMFAVHARLAVLSDQLKRLTEKVDQLVEADRARLPQCVQHQAYLDEFRRRLDIHDMQLAQLGERLQEV